MDAVSCPSLAELRQISESYSLGLGAEELEMFRVLLEDVTASYARLNDLEEPKLPLRRQIEKGRPPTPEENLLNAWYWRSAICNSDEGLLAGRTVAVKDNIAVAGLPMMNGSVLLDGYVPDFDATVVTRILDAGAEVAGKSACEHLCFSGSSYTCDTGPILNPYDRERSAGGSSSGSAALVAAGQVDLALGGDQGGSVRIPSAWCGTYGLKPSYGLVPYTGAFPIEITLDHLGPIGSNVLDVIQMLQVIAGPDNLDPRQRLSDVSSFSEAMDGDVRSLKIGVLREAFAWEGASEPDVDALVLAAADKFATIGAAVEDVSVPIHAYGVDIWNGIATEGALALMIQGNGMGTNWKGHYSNDLLVAYAEGKAARAAELSDTVKLVILAGQHMRSTYHGRFYGKAQNLARKLNSAYDMALEDFDLLLMPTVPMKAPRLPGPETPRAEKVTGALDMMQNTCPFNVTGHPAMNVPCGTSDGLPVGLMLVGRHGDDVTVLRAARAFELTNSYKRPPLARASL